MSAANPGRNRLAQLRAAPPKAGPASPAAVAGDDRPRNPDHGGEPPAVKVVGYLGSEKGVGEGARATIRALRAAGIPFLLETIRDPTSEEYLSTTIRTSLDRVAPRINLFHINPEQLLSQRDRLIAERAGGRVNIGYWAWELPELPTAWVECLHYVSEVWTPSTFVANAVAPNAAVPVLKIPHCLDMGTLKPGRRSAVGGRFTFFFMFDHLSDLGRKNPLGVIKAFRRAFTKKDPVELVMKSMHSAYDPGGAAAVRAAAAGARVRLIDGVLPRAEVLRLLADCDCYVSLHRAEGFGLPLAEAMALSKPVIATGYSGNTDFMTPENSFLVKYSMVAVGSGHGDYEAHQQWAEPDLDHAASLMRTVVADGAMAARVGEQAQEDVVRTLHPTVIGAIIRDRIARVAPARQSRPTPSGVRCSIIIPAYGNVGLTRNCLRSVLAGGLDPRIVEIIVVDDASSDDTAGMLREFGDRVRVITHQENLGFAQSCNNGAAAAGSDVFVFLNNDTVPRPGWLGALLAYARTHPEAGIVGAKLLYPDGRVQHAGVVICEDHRPWHIYRGFPEGHPAVSVSRRFQVVTGACMLVRRALFTALGGFDLAFRNGFEDVDLCLRAGEIGSQVHYCADCVVEHRESATRRGRSAEELRNRNVYWDRWGHRVIPDELKFYCADGLLRIKHRDLYPLELQLRPELAFVAGQATSASADAGITAMPQRGPVPPARSWSSGQHPRPRMAPPRARGR